MKSAKVIVAQYVDDWAPPYSKTEERIPVVIASNHPRFQPGQRFDYSFLQIALAQGYIVIILPTGKLMTDSEAHIFGQAEPEEISPHL